MPLQQLGIRFHNSFLCNPSFSFPLILNHSKWNTDTETAAQDFCYVNLSCVDSRENPAERKQSTPAGHRSVTKSRVYSRLSLFIHRGGKYLKNVILFCKSAERQSNPMNMWYMFLGDLERKTFMLPEKLHL